MHDPPLVLKYSIHYLKGPVIPIGVSGQNHTFLIPDSWLSTLILHDPSPLSLLCDLHIFAKWAYLTWRQYVALMPWRQYVPLMPWRQYLPLIPSHPTTDIHNPDYESSSLRNFKSYWNYWGFGLLSTSGNLKNTKEHNVSETWSVSIFRYLQPLHIKMETDRVSKTLHSLEYQAMGKVQKPNNSKCHTSLSEPYRIY
jgi:hypothetical protein